MSLTMQHDMGLCDQATSVRAFLWTLGLAKLQLLDNLPRILKQTCCSALLKYVRLQIQRFSILIFGGLGIILYGPSILGKYVPTVMLTIPGRQLCLWPTESLWNIRGLQCLQG